MSPRGGACDFWTDPKHRAGQAPVFWHPDDLAAIVQLRPAQAGDQALTFASGTWPGRIARRDAADGCHLILEGSGFRHQLWLPEPTKEGDGLAAVIPLDASAAARADAALRFWRHIAHGPPRIRPWRDPRLDRLALALRALDGHLAGASYRAIAQVLFGADRVAAETWKTASLRDTTIRLVRKGLALMQGGYRDLLANPTPDRS